MNWYTISLPLIAVNVLLYHIVQKNMPRDANPLVAIASAYALGAVACLGFLFINGEWKKGAELLRGQNWLLVALLGASAVGVELGFLYAYRTGWKISTTAVSLGSFNTIALALVGVLWYKEQISALNVLGMTMCLAGVVCINWK